MHDNAVADPAPQAVRPDRARLEEIHHEICTALTVLRSNVELVRSNLRDAAKGGDVITVHAHLSELDAAVDRLQRVAQGMKNWSGDP